MKIVKIKGQFLVPQIGATGYVTEDGGVFIDFKGEALSKAEFEKKQLAVLGFTVTTSRVQAILSLYDSAASEFGFGSKEEVVEKTLTPEETVEETPASEAKEVVEEAPKKTAGRRGRRKQQ
jgi:hypothetical protein